LRSRYTAETETGENRKGAKDAEDAKRKKEDEDTFLLIFFASFGLHP